MTTGLLQGIFASSVYFSAVVFDEKALVPLGTIFVVGGGIWWLGRKLQSLEDGQKSIEKRFDNLPCKRACKEETK